MLRNRISRAFHALALAGVLFSACANDTEDDPNVLLKPTAEGPCADMLVEGDWYRFNSLAIAQLGGGASMLLDQLNGLWSADILKDELNIVFKVIEINSEKVTLEIYSGARVGEGDDRTFCLLDGTKATFSPPLTESGIGPSEGVSVVVFSGSQASPKNCGPPERGIHGIPVLDAVFQAGCDADQGLISGTIKGAIRKEVLDATCTCLVTDDSLSDAICGELSTTVSSGVEGVCEFCVGEFEDGKTKNYSSLADLIPIFNGNKPILYECTDASDGATAVCLDATFDASRVPFVPTICK